MRKAYQPESILPTDKGMSHSAVIHIDGSPSGASYTKPNQIRFGKYARTTDGTRKIPRKSGAALPIQRVETITRAHASMGRQRTTMSSAVPITLSGPAEWISIKSRLS